MKNNINVLIADDTAQFGRECQKELKKLGFDVLLTKKDGARVISLIESQHIDVVLMDIRMKDCDGVMGTRLIK